MRHSEPLRTQQVLCSAVALGAMSLYLTMLGRGIATSLLTLGVIAIILFVTFDLDRPQRGFITVPSAPLEDVRTFMDRPPAADAP